MPASAFAAKSGLNDIRFGYAAITWGKEERQAIDDIATAGYQGIQLRADALTEFKPEELRDLLAQHKLTFVALSSGDVTIDPRFKPGTLAIHTAHAKYLKDAGGQYLQILDKLTPYPRTSTIEEAKQLGKLLTELGKRTADLGVPLAYHNHLNTIGEHPAQLDAILETSDPKYVKLLLDVAHSQAGGGDPAAAIRKYHERILFLHLKDYVEVPADSPGARYPFQWMELGRGRVDLPAVFTALEEVKFRGWAVVELDRVPDKKTTPLQAAMTCRKFLEEKGGGRFGPAA